MWQVAEHFYSFIESMLVVVFISTYFDVKNKFHKMAAIGTTLGAVFASEEVITYFHLHWSIVLIGLTTVIICCLRVFYKGGLIEQVFIATIAVTLLAIIDVVTLTAICKVLDVDYSELVTKNNSSRLLAVILTKVIYFIVTSIIVTVKRRYTLIIKKTELIMINVTLFISCAVILLVRNIIYDTKSHYTTFLILLIFLLLLNIGQYFTLIYINRKNIDEKELSLMQKQLEMQSESLSMLERKYDETAKIRHDFKNYITSALSMAEQGDNPELISYLRELSERKINSITSYINLNRKVLGAVVNTKLSEAKQKDYKMQCMMLSELDTISDTDAGILLANLLDNAIEACDKNSGDSEIILKTWSNEGYYCIQISNTVETNILSENPHLRTSKDSGELHGIGLRSVKDIVDKYEGIISFNQKNGLFNAYVMLKKQI